MKQAVFAVVGHVNKGKSSIVAALSEDDSVHIERWAGTTTECRPFPLRIDGRTLFTLVDTPGFEQARHALAWMREHSQSAADRAEVVAEFIRAHESKNEFPEECKLLKPIIEGAGILYVVDGSRPYSAEYEAEMEILSWTGRPRMALINRISDHDFSEQWRSALDQYFSIVHSFNAQQAEFDDRIRLLEAFRELREEWRAVLNEAIGALQNEFQLRQRDGARIIAELIDNLIHLIHEKKFPPDVAPNEHKEKLFDEFLDQLRKRERFARDRIEDVFQHSKIERLESELELHDEDLFSRETWLRLGLSRTQLAASGVIGGMLIGGGIDAAFFGASFLTGTVIGGAVGGLSGWLSAKPLSKTRIAGITLGGNKLTVGPIHDRQFSWIALDRALMHFEKIRGRSHAKRDEIDLNKKQGIVSQLGGAERKNFDKAIAAIQKASSREDREAAQELLSDAIQSWIDQSS